MTTWTPQLVLIPEQPTIPPPASVVRTRIQTVDALPLSAPGCERCKHLRAELAEVKQINWRNFARTRKALAAAFGPGGFPPAPVSAHVPVRPPAPSVAPQLQEVLTDIDYDEITEPEREVGDVSGEVSSVSEGAELDGEVGEVSDQQQEDADDEVGEVSEQQDNVEAEDDSGEVPEQQEGALDKSSGVFHRFQESAESSIRIAKKLKVPSVKIAALRRRAEQRLGLDEESPPRGLCSVKKEPVSQCFSSSSNARPVQAAVKPTPKRKSPRAADKNTEVQDETARPRKLTKLATIPKVAAADQKKEVPKSFAK